MSDRPESLAAALAELQQHLPRIGKDKTARVQTKTGRDYTYDYANLATVSREILPMLGELGLSFTCYPSITDPPGAFVLHYELIHVSGEFREGSYPLPSSGSPQEIGSAITYARRYCLLAVTGAAPDEDDDDAQAAEQAARNQRQAPPEVRADGSATDAELTRMNRGHEPGAWRSDSTAENDGWYDQPNEGDAIEDRPRTSLPGQRQGIYIALGRHGIKDFKSAIERLTRRDITDPKDMSYNEAVMVRARVDAWDGHTEELLAPLAVRQESDA